MRSDSKGVPAGPLPNESEKARRVQEMFNAIAPRYDLVNRVMTFGLDQGWRRKTVDLLQLPPGSLVADVACGTGDFCNELQRRGINAIGIDFSPGMLAAARTRAPLVAGDALAMPVGSGSVDGITCGFALRNVADLPSLFGEMARVLRAGGRIGVLEVDEPRWAALRSAHRFYFHRVVPVIGGALSNRQAYRYLPASTVYLPPPSRLRELLGAAGFVELRRRQLGLGAVQIITGTRV